MKLTKLAIPSDSKLPFAAGILFSIYAITTLLAAVPSIKYSNQIPIYYFIIMIIGLLAFVLFAVICFAFAKRNVKYFLIPIIILLAYKAVSYGLNIYRHYQYQIQTKGMVPSAKRWNFFTVSDTICGILWIVVLLLLLLLVIGLKSAKLPCLIASGLYIALSFISVIPWVVSIIQQFGRTSTTLYATSISLEFGSFIVGLALFTVVLSINEVNEPESLVFGDGITL